MMSKSVGRKPSHQKWAGLQRFGHKTRSSNSMNHSGKFGNSVQEERLMLQQSLMDIVNVYDKNRT